MCSSAGTLGQGSAHGALLGVGGEGASLDNELSSLSCLNDAKCDVFNVDNALVKSIATIISTVAGAPNDKRWGRNGQGGGGGGAGMDKAVRNETEGELRQEGGKNIIC